MDNSMARQRYSTSRPMRNRRRRRIPNRNRGLRKLILFQSLICVLIFLMVLITKNIHISATDYITGQIKYVLEHNVEPKSILAYGRRLAVDIRDSIIKDSGKGSEADELKASGLAASPQKAQFSDDLQVSVTTPPLDYPEPSNHPLASDPDQSLVLDQAYNSVQASDADQKQDADRDSGEPMEETPFIEGNLSISDSDIYETADDDVDLADKPETSVLSASSSGENENQGSTPKMLSPVIGTLATDFGQISVPASGNSMIHSGIDINVEKESNVKAALNGVVTQTGSSAQYGKYIRLKHDNGIETVYAHCSGILAHTGEIVDRGDVIAQVGDDSICACSHLHFEVWLDGENVDPLEYISVGDR